MKFTSEDLMKAMGLSVGDRVKCKGELYKLKEFEIIENDGFIYLKSLTKETTFSISCLVNEDYDILPRPKRVGNLKCGEYGEQNCNSCPIRAICVSDEYNNDTLYEKLELSHKYAKDQEIYDLLKARLDKEVK